MSAGWPARFGTPQGFTKKAEDERGKGEVLVVFRGFAKILRPLFPVGKEGCSCRESRRACGAGARA